MASSADQQKVSEEVDGNNQVVPAGTEKPKKKGLFGLRSPKHEGKTKGKAKEKEDIPHEEVKKDKKSEKTESKKEGTRWKKIYTVCLSPEYCLFNMVIWDYSKVKRKIKGNVKKIRMLKVKRRNQTKARKSKKNTKRKHCLNV